ncbi:hypothetical protein BT96DRAFT_944527 [Gymnopus androsaceus JB14]|uniref:Uncharacterized protein n=1 Tax=Gymnopus androsaceus JB14 TaxID=1447944 RepID=A0A6A4H4B2_9AGAR|nr:hypothetical protein BT96DRAFT_944527 [Gymnopus androsaceus JB14]
MNKISEKLEILNSYSHSRMFLQVSIQEVGLLALARNLANYVLMVPFCAWLPPPGIPDDILLELCDELLAACKTFVPGHSRHSSASSATNDGPVEQETPDKFPTAISKVTKGKSYNQLYD